MQAVKKNENPIPGSPVPGSPVLARSGRALLVIGAHVVVVYLIATSLGIVKAPSLVADASGVARFGAEVHSISLAEGTANNVVGRALVVHRDRDDYTSQPAGNSGPRIACAVIARG